MTVMTKDQVFQRVEGILMEQFELVEEQLKPEANLFTDLGLDSLDAIDLVIAFQREFKIKPTNQELQEIRTIADVHQLVARYYDKSC